MQLGISSYAFAWAVGVPGAVPDHPMTSIGLVDKALELNLGLVQIADNLPLHRRSNETVDELARYALSRSIGIELGTRGIKPEHLYKYLELAKRVRSPILRVVVDNKDERPSPGQVVDLLNESLGAFEHADVRIAIENHDRFKASTLAQIIERIGSRFVGICLDTVNSFGASEGPDVVVSTLAPFVINVHIKDYVVHRASHKMGFTIEGRPAGRGQLNVNGLLESLERHGRDPNLILELWTPPEPTLEATIAKESEWARQSVDYLVNLFELRKRDTRLF